MQTEDVAVSIRCVVERRDEVLEGIAGVVCKLRKERLRLGFGQGSHIGRCLRRGETFDDVRVVREFGW